MGQRCLVARRAAAAQLIGALLGQLPLEALPWRQGSERCARRLLRSCSHRPAAGQLAWMAARYRRFASCPITGGLGVDRRKPALGPSRGLGDASGALIRFHGDGLAGRLGVAW